MSIIKAHVNLFLVLVCLFFIAACNKTNNSNASIEDVELSSDENNWSTVTLPEISSQVINLRVAQIINPRFKKLSDEQTASILKRSQQLIKKFFHVEVSYSAFDTLFIDDVFSKRNAEVVKHRKKEIIDIGFITKDTREDMQQAIFKTLLNYKDDKSNVIEYARPFLLEPNVKHKGFISLSYALSDTLISRLSYWKQETADDGKPVLDGSAYNQWVWWDSLGYGDLPYDVVITNQLVVSAENYGMDVHSSIRGGITAGTTTYNKQSDLNSYVYIMVYPMLNDTALLNTLRQDAHYTDEQIINYSAALLTHEIGHMLFHFGHPFGNSNCIMAPTTMLNYRQWYDALDSKQCEVGSSPAMSPGAVKLKYNTRW